MRLVADGEEGKLYINGHHIADLQLQGLMDEGYVYAVGSYFKGTASTGYSNALRGLHHMAANTLR